MPASPRIAEPADGERAAAGAGLGEDLACDSGELHALVARETGEGFLESAGTCAKNSLSGAPAACRQANVHGAAVVGMRVAPGESGSLERVDHAHRAGVAHTQGARELVDQRAVVMRERDEPGGNGTRSAGVLRRVSQPVRQQQPHRADHVLGREGGQVGQRTSLSLPAHAGEMRLSPNCLPFSSGRGFSLHQMTTRERV
jgi:hypothetical protein